MQKSNLGKKWFLVRLGFQLQLVNDCKLKQTVAIILVNSERVRLNFMTFALSWWFNLISLYFLACASILQVLPTSLNQKI